MPLSAGDRLGRYELLDPLGAGGMGEVYRAHDERLDRDVAIKVLPEAVARNAGRLARFEREAKAVAKLAHPNILEIYDFGREGDVTYAVTELLEGETLRERLEGGTLGWRKAAEIGAAIADGLAAAHHAGIVHRDLKPSNVFLTNDGRVKILDFGLARTTEVPGAGDTQSPTVSGYTEPGAVLGTVGYMSPEQVRGEPADHRSDIFSLGCVLYEMVCGRRAFSRGTAAETMTAILREEPSDLRSLTGDLSPSLADIVGRCLDKKPDARFQASQDLAFALRSTLKDDSGPIAHVAPEEKSIVVLPFDNLSPDLDQEYFADGLTEEIISDLAKIGDLRVISRNSAIKLKDTDKDTRTIGRELGVQYLLQGSVRKAGNNLRITAQLIEAASDRHLWAEKYGGTLDDVFDIQEQVSRSIVDALKLELVPGTGGRPMKRPIENVHAYECYLRARQENYRFTEEGCDRALELIRTGLELAGDNAALHALMGLVYWQYVNIGVNPAGFDDYLEKAEECANKALELDPKCTQGYVLRALIFNKLPNQREAVRNLKLALAIEPNDADSLFWLATFLSLAGREQEARPLAERLLEVDPLGITFIVGWLDYLEGKTEAGLGLMRRGYEMAPEDTTARWTYVLTLAGNKRIAELSPIADSLVAESPTNPYAITAVLLKHALQGDKAEALRVVTPEMEATARRDDWLPWLLADGYALISEKDKALDWLEIAISRGFINYPFLSEHDPLLDNLRGEERFEKLMERAKHEWESFEA